MYIERNINPIQKTNMTADFHHYGESFYNVFQHALNNKSNSRPPKIEITGMLIPCNKIFEGHFYKYKLETDTKEYFLSMNNALEEVAKKVEWEEVTVKGYLDLETNVFEAEKISLSKINDSSRFMAMLRDPYYEIESYKRTIEKRGKIDPEFDDLAS